MVKLSTIYFDSEEAPIWANREVELIRSFQSISRIFDTKHAIIRMKVTKILKNLQYLTFDSRLSACKV